MRRNGRFIKSAFIILVGVATLPAIGFSSWAIGERSEGHGVLVVDDTIEDVSSGLSVEVTPLRTGKYFYEIDEAPYNSTTGYLIYTIGIIPAELPSTLKHDYENGYRFSFSGTISFSDDRAINLFSARHVISATEVEAKTTGITVSAPIVSPIDTSTTGSSNYMAAAISSFVVTTTDRSDTQQKFSLKIKFQQSLLLDTVTIGGEKVSYQNLLREGYFTFHLSGSGGQ